MNSGRSQHMVTVQRCLVFIVASFVDLLLDYSGHGEGSPLSYGRGFGNQVPSIRT